MSSSDFFDVVIDLQVAADSASSTSTYTLPSHHGPSRTLAAKKAVKLINKGIQAGQYLLKELGKFLKSFFISNTKNINKTYHTRC